MSLARISAPSASVSARAVGRACPATRFVVMAQAAPSNANAGSRRAAMLGLAAAVLAAPSAANAFSMDSMKSKPPSPEQAERLAKLRSPKPGGGTMGGCEGSDCFYGISGGVKAATTGEAPATNDK